MLNKKLKKELIIRTIKIIDIGFITVIYLLLGMFLAKKCDDFLDKFNKDDEEKKPLYRSILELLIYLWFTGIVIYIVRNIVPLIPYPLNGIYGYDHLKVKEVTSASLFSISFLYFQTHYQNKMKYVYSKLSI
jgi:hypothetical protein